MIRRLRKNVDATDKAVLEDLAAEHHTSVEKVLFFFFFER